MGDYGNRPDGSKKGTGWLGELKRPDGSVMTEYSVQFDDILGGTPIPLIVPTLSKDEINLLLNSNESTKLPKSIYDKAIDHALSRDKMGLSPYRD